MTYNSNLRQIREGMRRIRIQTNKNVKLDKFMDAKLWQNLEHTLKRK